jgi:hypothetical protein
MRYSLCRVLTAMYVTTLRTKDVNYDLKYGISQPMSIVASVGSKKATEQDRDAVKFDASESYKRGSLFLTLPTFPTQSFEVKVSSVLIVPTSRCRDHGSV